MWQVKSKQRVVAHGEVFTAEREVKAMCDLVKSETERIDSRFLEPACGEGNFLLEILARKLAVVKRKYHRSVYDYERNSLLALGSLYGVDILYDNVIACRKRLYTYWDNQYKVVCRKKCSKETRQAARFILSRNIVCGNALTLRCVDEDGNDTDEPIVFSEWTFPFNNALMQRKDYTFDELLNGSSSWKRFSQGVLFEKTDLYNRGEGKFLRHHIAHYRRLHENAGSRLI